MSDARTLIEVEMAAIRAECASLETDSNPDPDCEAIVYSLEGRHSGLGLAMIYLDDERNTHVSGWWTAASIFVWGSVAAFWLVVGWLIYRAVT